MADFGILEVISLASAAVGAYSAYSQGQAAKRQAQSQEQAAETNAKIAQINADNAMAEGNANEEAQRRKARMVLGEQRAALAQAGIGNDGTASDLYEQSATSAELDALNIRYGATLQRDSYLNQSGMDTQQARAYAQQAKEANTASYIGAGASVLSGYGNYLGTQAKITAAKKGLQ